MECTACGQYTNEYEERVVDYYPDTVILCLDYCDQYGDEELRERIG